jgi:hypothetical protein
MALIEKKDFGSIPLKTAAEISFSTSRMLLWDAAAPEGSRTATVMLQVIADIIGIEGAEAAIDAFRANPIHCRSTH